MNSLPLLKDLPEKYKKTDVKEVLEDIVYRIIGDLFDVQTGHPHDGTVNGGPVISAGGITITCTATGLTWTPGTSTLSLTSDYVIPTTTEETNWNSAYGWGNHASMGYYLSGATASFAGLTVTTGFRITPFTTAGVLMNAVTTGDISSANAATLKTFAGYYTSGDAITTSNLTDSGLTITRIPYVSTNGLLVDSSTFTFDGTTVKVPQLTDSGLTTTRIPVASTNGLLVDFSNFYYAGNNLYVTGVMASSSIVVGGPDPSAATHNGTSWVQQEAIEMWPPSTSSDYPYKALGLYVKYGSTVMGRIDFGSGLIAMDTYLIRSGVAELTVHDTIKAITAMSAPTITGTTEIDSPALYATGSSPVLRLYAGNLASNYTEIKHAGVSNWVVTLPSTWTDGQFLRAAVTGSAITLSTAAIPNNYITYAMIQVMSGPSLLGRFTAGPGNMTELALDLADTTHWLRKDGTFTTLPTQTSALLSTTHTDTLADSVVAGDLLIGNATPKWARLGVGTDGYILQVNATTHLPNWVAPSAASMLALPNAQVYVGKADGTGPAAVAMSGDVSIVASGATTIAAQAIGVAKMTATATNRVFGRITAGAGAGEELTGANISTILGTAYNSFPPAYGHAWRDATFSGTSTASAVGLTAGNNDMVNISHSTSTNPSRMTVTNAGVYMISYFCQSCPEGVEVVTFYIFKNGNKVSGGSCGTTEGSAGYEKSNGKTIVLTLAANDYIEIYAAINNASSRRILASWGENTANLTMVRVG